MTLDAQEEELVRKCLATAGAIDDGVRQFKQSINEAIAALGRIEADCAHFRQLTNSLGLNIQVKDRMETLGIKDE